MKYRRHEKEQRELLSLERDLTVADFSAIYPEMPKASVYALIRGLVKEHRLSPIGKGKYLAIHKPEYRVPVSPWMHEVNEFLNSTCEGVNHCLKQSGDCLEVQVARSDLSQTIQALKSHYPKVAAKKDADHFPGPLNDFIFVSTLISESPIMEADGVSMPSLEKELVDAFCRAKNGKGAPDILAAQKLIEIYPVNYDRMSRYAARRGVAQEFEAYLSLLDKQRVEMFSRIQRYLTDTAVIRAWVFGSFARGEETQDSDLDLLVSYDKNTALSLLGTIRYQLDLEKITGRQIDLVEEGSLKPFAQASANRDKYLIYER